MRKCEVFRDLAMCNNAVFHQDWQDILDAQGEIRSHPSQWL